MSEDIKKEMDEMGIAFKAIDLENPIDLDNAKLEILKKEKEAAIVDGMIKMASYNGRTQDPYPSPFLNLSDTQIPKTTSEIFQWCKYFYTFDPLIAGAINALATFPVTEIYLEDREDEQGKGKKGEDSESLKLYKKMFFKNLNMYKLLIEIGIDYYLYGNCFVFGEMYTNPATGGIEWKTMVRLDPTKVIIDFNPVTQEKKYKWQVSPAIANIIKNKKPIDEYNKIPEIIKNAVKKNNAIVLNPNNIYHFSRPTDSSGSNVVWGTPVPANVLKLLMYRNILRQAQEAIAREHIVPFRVYYLERTNDYNPTTDWNSVAQNFAGELMKAVKDPNYKVVSPVPVNLLNIGGQGRALLLTPEIEQIQSEILAGMNVPREFIFGGVSYSGSSISLKILENQFITYRLLLKDFMQNFVIKNMAKARKEWVSEMDDDSLVSVKMVELKMQDDVQQKQLIIQLNQVGKVTNEYMWKVLGIDPDKMKKSLEDEALETVETDTKIKLAQLDAQLLLQKKQIEIEAELQKHQAKIMPPPSPEEIAMMGGAVPPGGGMAPGGMIPPQAPPTTPKIEGGGQKKSVPAQTDSAKVESPADEDAKIKSIALQLAKVNDKTREQFLSTLPDMDRRKIMQELQKLLSVKQSGGEANKIDMRPMPEQKPPRRNSLK